ncbi:MAG: glycosyltransferase family 2 protein [Candidatus Cloacimonas sp.]
MDKSVTVIVPTYNEEGSIPLFFPKLADFCQKRSWKLIIVNDCSTDFTAKLLEDYSERENIQIIRHKVNKGYGAAIKTGIKEAKTDLCLTIDADGQHTLEDMDKLYRRIILEDADMVMGSRKGQKSVTAFKGFGKWIIRTFAKLMMPVKIYDLNTGMRIFQTELAQQVIHQCPDGMSFSDTFTLIFINYKHFVLEEPITILPRTTGKSKTHLKTAFETLMEIINIIVMFSPLRIFLPLAALFFVAGFLWGIRMILLDKGITSGSAFMMLMGVLLFLLGLITEQISLIRKNKL